MEIPPPVQPPAPQLTPAQRPPRKTVNFPASFGWQMRALLAYTAAAALLSLLIGANAFLVFAVVAASHFLLLFGSTLDSLLAKRWKSAAVYALVLLAVPLVTCGFCLTVTS
jgi:hypothetical protein